MGRDRSVCRSTLLVGALFALIPCALAGATWPVHQHDLGCTGQAEAYVHWPYEPEWSTPLLFDGVSDDGQVSRLVSDGTLAFVGSNYFHVPPLSTEDMSVWAVRVGDGTVAWETNVGGNLIVSPQIAGDHIVAGVWDARFSTDDDFTSTLWVLNRVDGSVVRSHPFAYAGENVRCGLPAAADGVVVIYTEGYDTDLMGLHAFRLSDGEPLWFYPTNMGGQSQTASIPPCIQDGRVCFAELSGGYDVRCLDLQTGAEQWVRDEWDGENLSVYNEEILVADGRVYFCGRADSTMSLFCIDAATNAQIWRSDAFDMSGISGLALGPDAIYALGSSGYDIEAFSLADGARLEHVDTTGGQVLTVASDGSVFFQHAAEFTVYEPHLSAERYLFDVTGFSPGFRGGFTYLDGRILMPFPDDCVGALRHDITPPVVTITDPDSLAVVNPGSSITIRSAITEFNDVWWRVEYAPLHDPTTWTEIDSGFTYSSTKTTYTSWPLTEVLDGEWIVRVVATDEAGLSGQDTVVVTLDRTRPESEITAPSTGLVFNTLSIEVEGTASDNMEVGSVDVWDSVSGQWHRATGTSNWTCEWIGTSGCQEVTLRSRATDWAGNVEATPFSEVTVSVVADAQLIPIFPSQHSTPSEVMQGGTLHRSILIADAAGNPLGGARICYADTSGGEEYAVADSDGIVDLDVWTQDIDDHSDPIGDPIDAVIDVTRVRSGGGSSACDLGALEPWPDIPVTIRPRDAQHFWTAGLGGSVKAGITAYVTGSSGGGTRLEIDAVESVRITQSWDVAAGVGVEFGMEEDLGIAEVGASAGAEVNLLLRGDEEYGFGQALCDDLGDSECRDRRQAYASVMIASLARNAMVLSNPLVDKIIGVLTAAAYSDWVESLSVAGGMSLEAGGGVSSSMGLESSEGAEGSLELSLIDGSIEMAFLVGMRAYPQGERVGFLMIQEIATSLSALTFSAFGNDMVSATELFGLEGANTDFTFTEEVIFDSLDVPQEFIFTISDGEGEVRHIFDDFDAVQQIVEHAASNAGALADSFNPTTGGGLQLGFEACRNELSNLYLIFQTVPHRVERSEIAEGTTFDFDFALDFNIQVITVGGALSVGYAEGREWTAEEIVFDGSHRHTLATYTRDSFVNHDDHTMGELLAATLEGLWTYVLDVVDWVEDGINGAVDWTLYTLGISGASARVGPLRDLDPEVWLALSGEAGSFSGTQDLAIIGFRPDSQPTRGLTVFGRVYNLQPEDLDLLKAVTLEIGHGEPVLPTGSDEADLGVFLWDNAEERWQAVASSAMSSPEHARTAQISQFGTYAVGLDLTPPEIHLLPPASEGFAALDEDFEAEVFDLVSDIESIDVTLDAQPLTVDHDTDTHLLTITLPGGLSAATHHLVITACDTAGNCETLERDIVFESTPPTAEITSPAEGEAVSGTVQIWGTASDAHFGLFTVQLLGQTTPGQWWLGVPSVTPVVGGVLAEFDSAMIPNDTYTLVLRVVDAAGQESTDERTIRVVNIDHVVDYLLGHTSDHRGCDVNSDEQIDAADVVETLDGL
jgi:outer membrane protein assembly factor BamB